MPSEHYKDKPTFEQNGDIFAAKAESMKPKQQQNDWQDTLAPAIKNNVLDVAGTNG